MKRARDLLEEFVAGGALAQRAADQVLAGAGDVDVATYSVGDYVWIRRSDRRHELQLARVQSAQPRRARGRDWWVVRLRFAKGWSPHVDCRPVVRALTPAEVTHERRLGLIPPAVDIPMPARDR